MAIKVGYKLGSLWYRYINELLDKQTDQVLVHQDLHADNILSAQRKPWLVIDPKPLVGEREFAIASVVRNKERARKWTVVQTFCWALGDGVRATMFDVVEWLIKDDLN